MFFMSAVDLETGKETNFFQFPPFSKKFLLDRKAHSSGPGRTPAFHLAHTNCWFFS